MPTYKDLLGMLRSAISRSVNIIAFDEGEMCIRDSAQTAVALLPATATLSQVDWMTVAGTAALAGVASILTSVAGLPEIKED